MTKIDIKNFTLEELKDIVALLHEPSYRAGQIFSWLYKRGAGDFNSMSNISQSVRDNLEQLYYIGQLKLSERLKSKDRTEKFLFKLDDGEFIETVLIPAAKRNTICISTQVGCRFVCSFCASGEAGFKRNLTPSEIIGQILFLQYNLKFKITNYVFMGMGEPLDNYENLSKAIIIMNSPQGLNIGARRITISTCGIIPGIDRLKELGLQVNLSVSLHAADDKLRSEIMPVNRRYPLEKLIKACERYIEKAGRIVTLEYILIRNKNDSASAAEKLAEIAKRLKAKVNLIPCSATGHTDFIATDKRARELFMNELIKRGVNATVRESKGADIRAACGQLAGKK